MATPFHDAIKTLNTFLPSGYSASFRGTIPITVRIGPLVVEVPMKVACTDDGWELDEDPAMVADRIQTLLRRAYPSLFEDYTATGAASRRDTATDTEDKETDGPDEG